MEKLIHEMHKMHSQVVLSEIVELYHLDRSLIDMGTICPDYRAKINNNSNQTLTTISLRIKITMMIPIFTTMPSKNLILFQLERLFCVLYCNIPHSNRAMAIWQQKAIPNCYLQ